MGRIVAYQKLPCKKQDTDCAPEDFYSEPLALKKCTGEKYAENLEFYTKFHGKNEGGKLADNSYCLDMDGFYLAGEPTSINEASLVIGFERHPDIIIDYYHDDYDDYRNYYYYYSYPILQVT